MCFYGERSNLVVLYRRLMAYSKDKLAFHTSENVWFVGLLGEVGVGHIKYFLEAIHWASHSRSKKKLYFLRGQDLTASGHPSIRYKSSLDLQQQKISRVTHLRVNWVHSRPMLARSVCICPTVVDKCCRVSRRGRRRRW